MHTSFTFARSESTRTKSGILLSSPIALEVAAALNPLHVIRQHPFQAWQQLPLVAGVYLFILREMPEKGKTTRALELLG